MQLLGAVLPALLTAGLAPLIGWLLSQRGIGRRTKEIENLLKRIELVERLQSLQKNEGLIKSSFSENLDVIVADIVKDLAEFREKEQPIQVTALQAQPWWQRFLLLYEQASLKGKVFKVLFYMFLFIAVFMVVMPLVPDQSPAFSDSIIGYFSGAFYMFLSLYFRAAAARDYRKRQGNTDLINKKSSI